MAAHIHELSRSWVLADIATILKVLVARSSDEHKHRDHYQGAHPISDPSSDGTSPASHHSFPFGLRLILLRTCLKQPLNKCSSGWAVWVCGSAYSLTLPRRSCTARQQLGVVERLGDL
jgi:hypothetical protein